jgi:hypothetical protein
MPACPIPEPSERVQVLVLAERPAQPEPMEVIGLYNHELDTSESAAMHAAYLVEAIQRRFLGWLDTLELATTLLANSAQVSNRASTAHEHFRVAREAAETITAEMSDAQDALDFHWPKGLAVSSAHDRNRAS